MYTDIMETIGEGSFVIHKGSINEGIMMEVLEVNADRTKALCLLSNDEPRWILVNQLILKRAWLHGDDL